MRRSTARAAPGDFHHERGRHPAHDHVVFHLSNGARVTYNDARRFGFMELMPRAELRPRIRCSGTRASSRWQRAGRATLLGELFAGKTAPLKAALLDQRLIAGLGNIYVCEALYRARLSPRRAAGTLAAPGSARPTPPPSALPTVIRRGSRGGDRGGRLVAARLRAHRRLARLFPAPFQGL